MSPETAKSLETKNKLLEGALRTLTEQGIARTSARTVASAAGVNAATAKPAARIRSMSAGQVLVRT